MDATNVEPAPRGGTYGIVGDPGFEAKCEVVEVGGLGLAALGGVAGAWGLSALGGVAGELVLLLELILARFAGGELSVSLAVGDKAVCSRSLRARLSEPWGDSCAWSCCGASSSC